MPWSSRISSSHRIRAAALKSRWRRQRYSWPKKSLCFPNPWPFLATSTRRPIETLSDESRSFSLMSLSLQVDSVASTDVVADRGTDPKPRVLVSIPSGFQLRQFVHSGVLDLLLKRGFQALIVSPNGIGEGFAGQVQESGVEVRPANPKNQGPLSWRYWLARHQILLNGQPTETMRQAMVDFRKRHLGLALTADACNALMRLFPRLRKRVLHWEYLLLRSQDLENLLTTKPVDLILLGSPGFMQQDALLLHAGVRRGIPVAAAI